MMNSLFRFTFASIFLAGLFVVGILGISTEMTYVWAGYSVLGLAGIGSVISMFRRTKFEVPNWCLAMALLSFGYLMIRSINSPVKYFAREDGVLIIACFVVYIFFISMLDDARWRRGVFWTITALVTINLIMASVQLMFGPHLWIVSDFERTFTDRIGGVFNHPDHFAGFMAIMVPFMAAAAIFGLHRRRVTAFLTSVAVLGFVAIILSGSLLGLIAVLIGLATLAAITTFLCWRRLSEGKQKLIIYGFASVAILATITCAFNKNRVMQGFDQGVMTRGEIHKVQGFWDASLSQFAESPWFGTGSRTFYYFSRKYKSDINSGTDFETKFVHNEYLQMLADYGLVGLLLIGAVLALHFYNGVQFLMGYVRFQPARGSILPKSNHLGMVIGSIAAIATLALLANFDFILHVPAIAMIAAVLIGILACPDPLSRALRKEEESSTLPGGNYLFLSRGLALGCGIALTVLGIKYGTAERYLAIAKNVHNYGTTDATQLKLLKTIRDMDPYNPEAFTLSAESYLQAIRPTMRNSLKLAYLEKADELFQNAVQLYPHNVDAAVAHSVVLDKIGKRSEAGHLLRDAREWAPLHIELMVAQAEHFLRNGDYSKAAHSFEMARNQSISPNQDAIDRGLELVTEWKRATGLDTTPILATTRTLPQGITRAIELSGNANRTTSEILTTADNTPATTAEVQENLADAISTITETPTVAPIVAAPATIELNAEAPASAVETTEDARVGLAVAIAAITETPVNIVDNPNDPSRAPIDSIASATPTIVTQSQPEPEPILQTQSPGDLLAIERPAASLAEAIATIDSAPSSTIATPHRAIRATIVREIKPANIREVALGGDASSTIENSIDLLEKTLDAELIDFTPSAE